jgi:formamidopyrimidine-DNA glycosylase
MPELPEVETIKIGLAKLLPGKAVKDVWYDWDKSFPNAPADVARFLVGAKIEKVRRRAKVLIIELNSGWALVIHLKMTGQLVYVGKTKRFGAGHPGKELVGELPAKSTRVVLDFTDGRKLFFNDQRKFGWMRLMPTLEIPEIGNIYADESLWGAKIHPATLTKDVPKAKLVALYNSLRGVLNLSIQKGGSTDRNYVDAQGKKGSYLSFANVFRREGQPCPRCGTPIEKIRVAGRGTHICPRCQKIPKSTSG